MKKLILFLLAITMTLTLFACQIKTPLNDDNDKDNNIIEDNNTKEPTLEDDITNIKLYFVNEEYILTGDDSLDKVIAVEKEIKENTKPIEEVILEELRNKPKEENLTTIVDKVKVITVETKENTAFVNLSGENLHGSSTEEVLILEQIVYSLTELEKIEQVQFLVDGSKQETLMGHMSIKQPLKREDVN